VRIYTRLARQTLWSRLKHSADLGITGAVYSGQDAETASCLEQSNTERERERRKTKSEVGVEV
jgi:predicted NUDIX family phosphoesterase